MLIQRKTMRSQSGVSMLNSLFLIIVFGFCLLLIATTLPSYINNRAVVGSLKQLADEPDFSDMNAGEVRTTLRKYFQINSVNDDAKKALKVQKKGGGKKGTVATVEYEHRESLFLNIDIVVSYHSVLDSAAPEICCSPK